MVITFATNETKSKKNFIISTKFINSLLKIKKIRLTDQFYYE